MSNDGITKPKGRSPDYRLKSLNKRTDESCKVGVAWINQDASISIVLNPGVSLVDSPDLVLTLFPLD